METPDIHHLTTEELGILSVGDDIVVSRGERIIRINQDDLSCSVRELAEGTDAVVGDLVISYTS